MTAIETTSGDSLVADVERYIIYTRPLAFKKIHSANAVGKLTAYSESTKAALTKINGVFDGVLKIKETADLLAEPVIASTPI